MCGYVDIRCLEYIFFFILEKVGIVLFFPFSQFYFFFFWFFFSYQWDTHTPTHPGIARDVHVVSRDPDTQRGRRQKKNKPDERKETGVRRSVNI